MRGGGKPDIDRAVLAAKADELERMIKRLKAMVEGLRCSLLAAADR